MGFVNFILELLKDPRAAIAGWIAMGVAPTLGFIFLIVFIETGVVFFPFLPDYRRPVQLLHWSFLRPSHHPVRQGEGLDPGAFGQNRAHD